MIEEVSHTFIKADDSCFSSDVMNVDFGTAAFQGGKDSFAVSYPAEGFASISDAIHDIHQGKMLVILGGEKKECKGYVMVAASRITPKVVDFLLKQGTGIIYVTASGELVEQLHVPCMDVGRCSADQVSATDLASTIRALASRESNFVDLNCSRTISLLSYSEGGVLERAGHAEAAVDLTVLAGLEPMGVLCELVCGDSSRVRLTELCEFANRESLKIVSVADIIRHRKMNDRLIVATGVVSIPTTWGVFTAHCYETVKDGIEHIAMVKGIIGDGQDVLVRVHSECLTGDIFGSARCDCGNQLAFAMQMIERAGRGVLVYNRGHEGRGIGLGNKLRAYALQDAGLDTVDANVELGLPVDSREYYISAQILRHLGVHSLKLLTNNPVKCVELSSYGLAIIDRLSVVTTTTKENERYLETKRVKMNHIFSHRSDIMNENGC